MALAINIVLGANTVNFSRNIQKATKKAEQELGGLAGFAQKAFDKINAGTLIGAGTLTTIAAAADKMQSLASKVKLATDGSEQFTAVQNQLRAVANEQRSSFEGVVDLYASSQRALSQLGKSQQNVIDFTRNMTMAMNLGGGSAQAQAAALTQLGQALGSGALRGDEFNSVAEQAPILMELIAKRMGVATAALRDLAKEGEITADVIYEAVSGSTQALEEMVSKTNFAMSQGWQVVKDNFGYLVHDIINETTGIAGAISNVLTFVGQNLKTIATIAGVAATAIGAKMAQDWLTAKFGADGFNASLVRNLTALRTATVATVQSAYSMQNYAMVAGRVGLALDYAKLSVASFGVAVLGGGVMAVEKANLVLTQAGATLTAYRTQLQATWVTTQAYIAQNFTLANAKAAVTASFATATTAVTGYITAKRTAIANTIAYIRSQSALTLTKNAFVGVARVATGGVMGFVGAVKGGTVALAGYTRALVTSTATKRAMVGTATLAGRAISGIGSAFASVGRIIMAHPIMLIAGVITAVIVRTMGLQKAMDSLSDAISIVGEMLGDFIDFGINNFKWLMGVVDKFFSSFTSSGKESTGFVNQYFGWLFEGTEGGFVGLLQVVARILDKVVGFFYAATRSMYRSMVNLWNGIKRGFVDAFNAVSKTIESSINGILDSYDAIIGRINGMIRDAKAAAAKVGLDGLVPDERTGTGGYRIKTTRLTYQDTENIGGNFPDDLNSVTTSSDKVKQAFAKVKNANNKAANAAELAAGSMEKMAAATGENEKATKKTTKGKHDEHRAQKETAKSGNKLKDSLDKASEVAKRLREAFNNQMLDWQKTIWENENVKAGLESERFLYELRANEKSQFYGLEKRDPDMASNLKAQALQVDKSNAFAEIDNIIKALNSENKPEMSKFSELLDRIYDANDKMFALAIDAGIDPKNLDALKTGESIAGKGKLADGSVDLGGVQIIIGEYTRLQKIREDGIAKMFELAQAEVDNLTRGYTQASNELYKQLDLQLAGSDVARELLTIEEEKKQTLKKHSSMLGEIAKIDSERSDELRATIEQEANHHAALRTKLFLVQQYQAITNDTTSEYDKQLKTLSEQFDVIGKLSALKAKGDDDLTDLPSVNTTALLDKSLGLNDNAQQDGVFAQLGQLNKQYEQRQAIIDEWQAKMRENLAGHEGELSRITKEAEERRTQIKRQHQIAQVNLGLAAGNEVVGQMADFAKSAFGEQSKHYRAMFALQKGFAIASASVSLYENVSKAMSLGFPDNIGAIAAATMQGVKILSLIRQIQNPIVGQAHDGIMSVPKSGTWNLEKGERVLPRHTAKALDDKLDSLQRGTGGQVVNVSVTVNADGNSDVQSSHELGKGLGNAIKLAVQTELQKERRQGGLLYGR